MRLLLVEHDSALLRALARSLSARSPELAVAAASSFDQALAQLQSQPIEVVLSDLDRASLRGLELLEWLAERMPHVPAFAMSAAPSAELAARLSQLGPIECFPKPLDPIRAVERIRAARHVRGHVRDFSLSSILQLVGMERKTCTLSVEQDARFGRLYLREGELVDAECDDQRGTDAAVTIAAWPSPSITISSQCSAAQRVIYEPLAYVLLEAMRRKDESDACRSRPGQLHSSPWSSLEGEALPAMDRANGLAPASREGAPLTPAASSLSGFDGAAAIVLADAEGKVVRSAQTRELDLAAWSLLASRLLAYQRAILHCAGRGQLLEEIVLATQDLWHLIRPCGAGFVLLAFDPHESSLMRRRQELERYLRALAAERRNG